MGLAKADGLYQGNGRARLERMSVLARLGHFLNDIVAALIPHQRRVGECSPVRDDSSTLGARIWAERREE
jgi:hypothetical protein